MPDFNQVHERVVSVTYQGKCLRSIESYSCLDNYSESPDIKKPVVVFLPAGLKSSAGPGRIFVKYARELAKDGFLCYRFDPLGIGISDGELKSGSIKDVWNRIEQGHFTDDLAAFATHIRKQHPERKIIICGLCGGAVTAALFAGEYSHLVDGVISINIEPFLSTTAIIPSGDETSTRINSVMKSYATKMLSAEAWTRLFSLKSDIRGILRFVKLFLLQHIQRDDRDLSEFKNINLPLIQAFGKIRLERTKHLMLFAEHDSCWHRFHSTYFSRLMESQYSSPYGEIKIVHNANHELQFREWRSEAFDYIKGWLSSNFRDAEKKNHPAVNRH
ncbi:MAG TPA: alpha/beta fold hydrolase [Gammaproteobacteria bacterium]|nr:alpha/beta fold hydrolase [Gammaproteobacteria bacterium]